MEEEPECERFEHSALTTNTTSIQTWDVGTALGSEHFDIIAWDLSLMQMVEVAYELRNNADYVVGSEERPFQPTAIPTMQSLHHGRRTPTIRRGI